MTDWKRAVLLIEYDDDSRTAFEFTELTDAVMTHSGLPGPAQFRMNGRVQALREFSQLSTVRDDALVDEIEKRNYARASSGLPEITIGGIA